jgi:hypothetical protein
VFSDNPFEGVFSDNPFEGVFSDNPFEGGCSVTNRVNVESVSKGQKLTGCIRQTDVKGRKLFGHIIFFYKIVRE